MLGRRIAHDVGAELQRLLQQRRGEDVVDDEERAGAPHRVADDTVQVQRVERLEVDDLDVEAERGVLEARLQELARQGSGPSFGTLVIQEVEVLIERIVRASYRPSLSQVAQDSHLSRKWRTLRWRLRWMWVLKNWKSLRHRLTSSLAGFAEQNIAGGQPKE